VPLPQSLEPTGPNVWWILGLLSVLGIGFLVNSGEESTTKLVNNLVNQWKITDSEREEAARDIGAVDRGSAKAERHRAAQESLSRAERIIMEFHEDSLKAHSRAVWLSAGLLMVCLVAALFLAPMSTSVARLLGLGDSPSPTFAQLYARVEVLERGRGLTNRYMLVAVAICGVGIVANLLLSVWRTKATARKVIRGRFDDFDTVFHEQLLSKLDVTEHLIEEKVSASAEINERLEGIQSELIEQHRLNLEAVAAGVTRELGKMSDLFERVKKEWPVQSGPQDVTKEHKDD
jgi:hypothetical protein